MLPGKVEGLRFLMFQYQAESGHELEHSGVSAFKLYKVFFPCFRLDDDRPVVNIGDELCIMSLGVELPENRCKVEGGENGRQQSPDPPRPPLGMVLRVGYPRIIL